MWNSLILISANDFGVWVSILIAFTFISLIIHINATYNFDKESKIKKLNHKMYDLGIFKWLFVFYDHKKSLITKRAFWQIVYAVSFFVLLTVLLYFIFINFSYTLLYLVTFLEITYFVSFFLLYWLWSYGNKNR